MDVLKCSVKGCINIMCDCYIPEAGYICIDCQNKFIEQVKHNTLGNEEDIIEELKIFMSFPVKIELDNSEMILKFFKNHKNQ